MSAITREDLTRSITDVVVRLRDQDRTEERERLERAEKAHVGYAILYAIPFIGTISYISSLLANVTRETFAEKVQEPLIKLTLITEASNRARLFLISNIVSVILASLALAFASAIPFVSGIAIAAIVIGSVSIVGGIASFVIYTNGIATLQS